MATTSQHVDVLLNQLKFRDKSRVKADLTELDRHYKSLIPRTGVLARNDGTMENVLVLGGTIPIVFGGVQYNIPLDMFVLEQYPLKAPEIYIRPTANMMIKNNHKNVDMQGLVYLPYLHTWSNSSNLAQLIHTASAAFSKEPPLFSKPVNQPPPPAPSPARVTYNTPSATNTPSANYQYNSGTGATTTSMASIYNGSVGGQQNQHSRPPQHQTMTMTSHTNVPDHLKEKREKDALISQITSMLQEEVLLGQTRLKAEIEQEFRTSQELKQNEEELEKYRVDLEAKKDAINEELAALARQDEELERWKSSKDQDLTSEEISQQMKSRLQPYDELSEQLVKLQSEHNAIDDAMYYLERALQRGHPSMTLELFLNKTRDLAGREFICRAHIRKIEGVISKANGGR